MDTYKNTSKHCSEQELVMYYKGGLTQQEKDKISFHLVICNECKELYEDIMFEYIEGLSLEKGEKTYVKSTMDEFYSKFLSENDNSVYTTGKLLNTYSIAIYSGTSKKTYPIIKLYNYKFGNFKLDIIQNDTEVYQFRIKSQSNIDKYAFVISDEEKELIRTTGKKSKTVNLTYEGKLSKKLIVKIYSR